MATPPVFSAGAVLTAAQMNAVGLWLVKTQTIGTTVSSVTVSNAFNSDFDNYKIIINGGTATGLSTITMQLGSSNTGYSSVVNYAAFAAGATPLSASDNGTAQWTYAGYATTNFLQMNMEINNPFATKYTTYGPANWAAGTVAGVSSGVHAVATSYTAFTFAVTGGQTMSGGTIRVYGYRN